MTEGMPSMESKNDPIKVMRYMEQMGSDISRHARTVIAMIEFAKKNNIPIDLSGNKLQKFASGGENEVKLINLRGDLAEFESILFRQGVKMKMADLEAQHLPNENDKIAQNLNSKEGRN